MLQSSLRQSRDVLREFGIVYPLGADLNPQSEAAITSGNAGVLLRNPDTFKEVLKSYTKGSSSHLFSNELMFEQWAKWQEPHRVSEISRSESFTRVEVLLFIRDPISHAASIWQQGVKRSGRIAPIEEIFEKYKVPGLVARLIKRLEGAPGINLTVKNYRVCKADLLTPFCEWLGVPPGTLIKPQTRTINRSLTRGELELQLAFNRAMGRSGDLLSDPLCEQLPDVRADAVFPSVEVQKQLWDRMRKDRGIVNTFVGPEHGYIFDQAPAGPLDGTINLSQEQVRVLAEALAARLKRSPRGVQ